jgi:all-trans-8'-apo-beta-carotenal 15,15'-oxygenase
MSSVCLPKNFNMDFDREIWLSNASVAPGRIMDFVLDLTQDRCLYFNYSLSSSLPPLPPTSPISSSVSASTGVLDLNDAEPRELYTSCEFPSYNLERTGKPWRYSYLMSSTSHSHPIPYQEIVKVDHLAVENERSSSSSSSNSSTPLRNVWSARSEYGVVGEPVFISRKAGVGGVAKSESIRAEDAEGEEDDGWVVTQLYNCREHRTEYVILDAKDLERGPIARLLLKHHTPYGFHGTFAPHLF